MTAFKHELRVVGRASFMTDYAIQILAKPNPSPAKPGPNPAKFGQI
jgi:hypothetical protein